MPKANRSSASRPPPQHPYTRPQTQNQNQNQKTQTQNQKTQTQNQNQNQNQKYDTGQHGAKGREQKRLTDEFGAKVDGKTHQSEHTIGFGVANESSGRKRSENPGLDKSLPAYQEMKDAHRKHPGTGSSTKTDESGFDSNSYREAQSKLLRGGDVSSAVQINQLGYAHDSNFKAQQGTWQASAAHNSFNKMVDNMDSVPYADGNKTKHANVTAEQRAEMRLARQAAETHKPPDHAQENAARRAEGLPEIKDPNKTIKP